MWWSSTPPRRQRRLVTEEVAKAGARKVTVCPSASGAAWWSSVTRTTPPSGGWGPMVAKSPPRLTNTDARGPSWAIRSAPQALAVAPRSRTNPGGRCTARPVTRTTCQFTRDGLTWAGRGSSLAIRAKSSS